MAIPIDYDKQVFKALQERGDLHIGGFIDRNIRAVADTFSVPIPLLRQSPDRTSAAEVALRVDSARRQIAEQWHKTINIYVQSNEPYKHPRSNDMQTMLDDIDRQQETPATRFHRLAERIRKEMGVALRRNFDQQLAGALRGRGR